MTGGNEGSTVTGGNEGGTVTGGNEGGAVTGGNEGGTVTGGNVGRAERVLVFGLGITGLAVVRALCARGIEVVAADDRPSAVAKDLTDKLGVRLLSAPGDDDLRTVLQSSTSFHPTPGLPERHQSFVLAREAGVQVVSEFDFATRWDNRPIVGITGTDGKTSVCTLATEMLIASGVNATLCGNTEVPLVEAIDNPDHEVFVVEASSFRLAHSAAFSPTVGVWLNYGPDHLDVHDDLSAYENSKAKIFSTARSGAVLVGNIDDPVVRSHLDRHGADSPGVQVHTFSRRGPGSAGSTADYHVVDGVLTGPDGPLIPVADLWRSFPHDIENVLAAAAAVLPVGATVDGVRSAAAGFAGLPHRVSHVATIGGVQYVDDSKATVPHATLSAIESFADSSPESRVVLIAGGRNKGLDLGPLADGVASIRAVVAIGDAADEVTAVFGDLVPVGTATSMNEAVVAATDFAKTGDIVLLSPACASFDWYRSYGERGDDFIAAVGQLTEPQ